MEKRVIEVKVLMMIEDILRVRLRVRLRLRLRLRLRVRVRVRGRDGVTGS